MPENPEPMTDEEVHDHLVAAREALGDRTARTARGETALATARRAMVILQFGLVAAMENDTDQVPGVLSDRD